jgi:hypothetical protein
MDSAQQMEAVNAFTKAMTELDEVLLRATNTRLVAEINARRYANAHAKARDFKCGQIVSFNDKYGRQVMMRITKFNTLTIAGQELHSGDMSPTGKQWRVAPEFCRAV